MEDDDEFGDLYTDVLTNFPSHHQPPPTTTTTTTRPIDLNINLNLQSDDDDDADGLPLPNLNSNPNLEFGGSQPQPQPQPKARVLHLTDLNIAPTEEEEEEEQDQDDDDDDDDDDDELLQQHQQDDGADAADAAAQFSAKPKDKEVVSPPENQQQKEDTEPFIPGLHTPANTTAPPAPAPPIPMNNNNYNNAAAPAPAPSSWDDEDSDSEDDLQIVLNDNNHGPMGSMGMGMGMDPMIVGSEDEDEDEDEDGDLVIVADDDAAAAAAPTDDQDWGDETQHQHPADAAPKDSNDAAFKANNNINNNNTASAQKNAFTNFAYHPFHSQFKYVRPGAAPLPGVPPGGASGQVRPPVNMGAVAGRGRGEWRPPGMKGPPGQKGFHPSSWGGNAQGRGLEFTLPSHKNIFDVDIDTFEEKPWKYPNVHVSDFFNFGMNEDSWKEYCKQLEQLRLESTMQSKIRVLESGRAEQEYDPDMPPELAAAAGIHDSTAENADITKVDGQLGDLAKGSARMRTSLPIGRAIQVETGYGERLPSIDTRPPRVRDSDAVIEIVLQDSVDDESTENGDTENLDNATEREDAKVDVIDDDDRQDGDGDEDFDRYPQKRDGMERDVARGSPIDNTDNMEMDRPSPLRASRKHHSGSEGDGSMDNAGSPRRERSIKGKARDRSPHMSSGDSALEGRSVDYQREDSIDSLDEKHSLESSSLHFAEDAGEPSVEGEAVLRDDVPADRNSGKVKDVDGLVSDNTSKDKNLLHPSKLKKLNSRAAPLAGEEVDDEGDIKASRSSDTSKATGSSRDHPKWRDGLDEEVEQNGRFANLGDLRKHHPQGGHDPRRKDRDGRMDMERNYILAKGRDEHHSQRDRDPHTSNHFHFKPEGTERRKDRNHSDTWQKQDEEAHGRRTRGEGARKQDDSISRHKGKVIENDKIDKAEYLHSRKILDNGGWRGHHEEDAGLRHRDREDSLRSRHELPDDLHSKRRKDDDHTRRDYVEKEVMLLAHRESSSSRRKRERDEISNVRKRDDQPRVRDSMDDHHSARLKDEVWVQRDRAEHQRERDDWYRTRPAYEDGFLRREREDGRAPVRSHRSVEEKSWVGHPRGRDDYKAHDRDHGRQSENFSRRDWVDDEAMLHHRGNEDVYTRQISYDGKSSRQERPSARNDRSVHALDKQRAHDKKHKENMKRARESESNSTAGPSKRHHGEKGVGKEMAEVKGTSELAETKLETSMLNITGDSREDLSTDDELHGSKKGRSKMERWTSHKDRDYDNNSKSSSSLKNKGANKDLNVVSGSSSHVQDESAKKLEDVNNHPSLAVGKDGKGLGGKDASTKAAGDGHIDTVEKLKRRSERFKLPLTSEKDVGAIKKMETEPLPPSKNDTPSASEVKLERPARKRRWISS